MRNIKGYKRKLRCKKCTSLVNVSRLTATLFCSVCRENLTLSDVFGKNKDIFDYYNLRDMVLARQRKTSKKIGYKHQQVK